jgi:hypothetical protein
MTGLKPWQESGSSVRGADMGRGGADPRAVWPYGVLTLEQAVTRLADAGIRVARHGADVFGEELAEAKAVLAAVKNPQPGPLTVEQVPLDEGYDEGGAYWGIGEPLFCAYSADQAWVTYARAASPRAALAMFKAIFPTTTVEEAR